MLGGKTILVVDDEADIVDILNILLAADGRTILSANDGIAALAIARERRPDLVITDVMMPGLDGRELRRLIRSDPELTGTRVMLMSAVHKLDLREHGEDVFIRKPFDIDALDEAVQRLLLEVG